MTDRSDAIVVTFTPCGFDRGTRRVVFEPYSDGAIDANWLRVEETLGFDGWDPVGSEPVESLHVDVGEEAVEL